MLSSILFACVIVALEPSAMPLQANQEALIQASNAGGSDEFGHSVALSGERMVIGAPHEDSGATGVNGSQPDDGSSSAGAAYVFVRNATSGTWSQEAYLKASNTGTSDRFGSSVSISGDRILVGAPREDSGAVGVNGDGSSNTHSAAGAAYVFVRDPASGVWSQEAYLKASNTDSGDNFGGAVSLAGDLLIVGARREDGSAGAAYVFVRDATSGAWSQEAYLKASNADEGDGFGGAVSISGNLAIVGATGEQSGATGVDGQESDNGQIGAGAAYVFAREASNGTWTQEAYLKASNTRTQDKFGTTVSISGERAVVGAPYESSASQGVNGSETNNGPGLSGAAYVFVRDAATDSWSQEAFVKASNAEGRDEFGTSVALSGDSLLIGAPFERSLATGVNGVESDNSLPITFFEHGSGAAYLFLRDPMTGQWGQEFYLKASNTGESDRFGAATAVAGERLVVCAPGELTRTGAAYAYDVLPIAFTSLCNGDGGDQMGCTNCPCMNNHRAGMRGGCLNSAASSALLGPSGDPSVSLPAGSVDDLRFTASNLPPSSFGVLVSGDAVSPQNPGSPCFGGTSGVQSLQYDGLRCASQGLRRHGGRAADSQGGVGITTPPWGGAGGPPAGIAQAAAGAFMAGQLRYFQLIHRDDPTLSCMRGLNTSQAIEVLFAP